MPQRETRLQPLALTSLDGVNERVNKREVEIGEWSCLKGTYPDFASLQSKIWGKRLLQKFSESVYMIYQLWTPMGYGFGIYQLPPNILGGPWIPSSGPITVTPLPIPIGPDGKTVTVTGGPDIIWTYRVPPNPPQDIQGGPIGPGTNCRYQEVHTDIFLLDVEIAESASSGSYSNTVVTPDVGYPQEFPFGCVPFVPSPEPLGGDCPPGPYVPVSPFTGNLGVAQNLSSTWTFVPTCPNPNCEGTNTTNQSGTFSGTKITIDLNIFQDGVQPERATLLITPSPGQPYELDIPLSYDATTNKVLPIPLDLSSNRPAGDLIVNGPETGFFRNSSVSANIIRLYFIQQICS